MSIVQQQAINILKSEYNFKFPWICRRCTYINDDKLDECCLCKFENPQYDPNVATEVLQRAQILLTNNVVTSDDTTAVKDKY